MKIVPPAALPFAIAALAFVGCASPNKPAAPPSVPVSANALASMRDAFTHVDANARLASVIEVLPSGDFLRLGEASPADFPVGTAVAIFDSSRNTIAHGEVVKSDGDGIDVKFEVSGPRPPKVGDVAVRFGQ